MEFDVGRSISIILDPHHLDVLVNGLDSQGSHSERWNVSPEAAQGMRLYIITPLNFVTSVVFSPKKYLSQGGCEWSEHSESALVLLAAGLVQEEGQWRLD